MEEKLIGDTDVPSQSADAHVRISIPLMRYLQQESFTALEYNLVLYIIEHSINFSLVKNGGTSLWVEISPSRYAEQTGHHRVAVSRSLSKLSYLGIFEVVTLKKLGQEYRSFRVVEKNKLNKALSDVSHANSKKPNRKKPSLVADSIHGNEENLENNVADSLHSKTEKINIETLDCSHTRYGHVVIRATAMYLYALRPCSYTRYSQDKITDRFQDVSNFQECINNLKEYSKNVSTFLPPSYYDAIVSSTRSRKERRDLQIVLRRSIDRYSLFSVWIAINVHLSSKELHFANFSVLDAILKNHKDEINELWEKVLLHVDNLFYDLCSYEIECDSKSLNFNVHAQLFLTSKRTENKSLIYFFDSIEEGIIQAFTISNKNIDSFKEKVIKKINLYFKAKIYGERELIHEIINDELLN